MLHTLPTLLKEIKIHRVKSWQIHLSKPSNTYHFQWGHSNFNSEKNQLYAKQTMNWWLIYIWATEIVYHFTTATSISFSHIVPIHFYNASLKTYWFYCKVCPSRLWLHLPLASSFRALSKSTSGRIKITKFLLLLQDFFFSQIIFSTRQFCFFSFTESHVYSPTCLCFPTPKIQIKIWPIYSKT